VRGRFMQRYGMAHGRLDEGEKTFGVLFLSYFVVEDGIFALKVLMRMRLAGVISLHYFLEDLLNELNNLYILSTRF